MWGQRGLRKTGDWQLPISKSKKVYFRVPEGPGLGIELNEKAISRYPRVRVDIITLAWQEPRPSG